MKVYSSIMKRIHRSLKKELKKLYQINKYTITEEQYFTILDHKDEMQGQNISVAGTDYEGDDTDVIPASDPALASDVQKLRQSQVIASVMQFGTVNRVEASRRILEAERIPDIAKLMEVPPPEPDFDQKIKMQELELKKQNMETTAQLNKFKVAAEAAKDEADAMLAQVQATALQMQGQMEQSNMQHDNQLKQMDMMMKHMEMQLQQMKTEGELVKIESMQAKSEMQKQQNSAKKYNSDTKTIE